MYDLVIIGAGPAGLSASVYASRYGIKNVIIGGITGGLVTETHEIGNWLGTPKISGFDFAGKAEEHAKSYGVEIIQFLVKKIEKEKEEFVLTLQNEQKVKARSVLLATGTKHRHLNVKGEKEMAGKGVSYCATCDGFFYRNKIVAVVGGNDSAAVAAVHLASIAEKVYIIYRGKELRAESFWVDLIKKNKKIEIIYNVEVKEIKEESKLTEIKLNNKHKDNNILKIDGLFIEIGSDPNLNIEHDLNIAVDEDGYIKVGQDGSSSEKGIWAAGDITTNSNKFKQIITAAAEGAIAVNSIQKYLKSSIF